jgi:hypothetical protein
MRNEEIWKLLTSMLGCVALIAGFIYWHFKTSNGFKDDIHKLELKYKDLEQSDKLQQQTIDQLKELFSLLKSTFKK